MARMKRGRAILVIVTVIVLCCVAVIVYASEAGGRAGGENNQTVLWLLGALQAVQAILWGWIKLDVKDLWKRANNHGHSIECDGDSCKPRTTGVLIRES